MEPKKYQYIDGLRGLAILLVMMLHCGQAGTEAAFFPPIINRIIENGQYGVQLFFLVSAYTLMLSYYSRRDEPNATRNFFIRRFFRIAPVYYLAIAYYFLQNFIGFGYFTTGHNIEAVSIKDLLANIFFVNGFRPEWINHLVPGGWSITVEFTFYFCLPFICRMIRNLNDSIVFVLVALVISSVLKLHHVLGNTSLNSHNFLYWYFPNQVSVFALGILSFFVIKGDYSVKPLTSLLVAATILFYCLLGLPEHFAYSLVFALLLIVLSKQTYPLLVNNITAFIGRMSFSIYLVHFAVLYWLKVLNNAEFIKVSGLSSAFINYGIRYSLVLSLSCLLCYFTYKFIELPFITLSRRLTLPGRAESDGVSALAQPSNS